MHGEIAPAETAPVLPAAARPAARHPSRRWLCSALAAAFLLGALAGTAGLHFGRAGGQRAPALRANAPAHFPTLKWGLPGIGSMIGRVESMSFGTLTGVAAGFAVKRVLKVAVLLVGMLFVAVQFMSMEEWIRIDWAHLERDIVPHLQNSPHQRVIDALSKNITFATAFSGGFLFSFAFL